MVSALTTLASVFLMSSRSFVVVDPALLHLPFVHPSGDPFVAKFARQGLDASPVLRAGDAQERERDRAETERDHAPPQALHDVVIALWCCRLQQLKFTAVQTGIFVELPCALVPGFAVWQVDLGCRALKDGGGNRRLSDVGQTLRRKHDNCVLFSKSLQPILNFVAPSRVLQEQPCLINGNERWTSIQCT